MQIILNQTEIETALVAYVRTELNIGGEREIDLELRAGRGENGFTATVEIHPTGIAPIGDGKKESPEKAPEATSEPTETATEASKEETTAESKDSTPAAAEAAEGASEKSEEKPKAPKASKAAKPVFGKKDEPEEAKPETPAETPDGTSDAEVNGAEGENAPANESDAPRKPVFNFGNQSA